MAPNHPIEPTMADVERALQFAVDFRGTEVALRLFPMPTEQFPNCIGIQGQYLDWTQRKPRWCSTVFRLYPSDRHATFAAAALACVYDVIELLNPLPYRGLTDGPPAPADLPF